MRRLRTTSTDATLQAGRDLGEQAVPGTIVALQGDLGAGKTVFARGVGAGLAVTTRVQSPTFIILATHTGGRLPLSHADLYRLTEPEDLEQLGLDEVVEGDGVVLVEWADRFDWLPADHLEIRIEHDDDDPDVREIVAVAHGPRHAALLDRLWGN